MISKIAVFLMILGIGYLLWEFMKGGWGGDDKDK